MLFFKVIVIIYGEKYLSRFTIKEIALFYTTIFSGILTDLKIDELIRKKSFFNEYRLKL